VGACYVWVCACGCVRVGLCLNVWACCMGVCVVCMCACVGARVFVCCKSVYITQCVPIANALAVHICDVR